MVTAKIAYPRHPERYIGLQRDSKSTLKTMFDYQAPPETQNPETLIGKYLTPFQRQLLQRSLQPDLPPSYRQRIEIMLLADAGKSQTQICRSVGCCPATARHWTYIVRSGMAHQWQNSPIGRPKAVNERYMQRLRELLTQSPRDYGYGFRRWTVNWLNKHLAKEFGVELSDRHLKRVLKQLGLSTKFKPHHGDSSASFLQVDETGGQTCILISIP